METYITGTQNYRKWRKSYIRWIRRQWRKFHQWDEHNHKASARLAIRQINLDSSDEEIEELLVKADYQYPDGVFLD